MAPDPTLQDLALRIGLAGAAGVLVGYNREGRNQAAGLRTTTLVCLAACLAMVLANLLLSTSGKGDNSFAQMDPMRLPLGILSGMGFLGAGAILRRGDAVLGVTTAATLWFMTIVGLSFGAGELGLGAVGTVLGFAVVSGLRFADDNMHRKQRGVLIVRAGRTAFPEPALRAVLDESRFRVTSWAVTYIEGGEEYEARAELEWRGGGAERTRAPDFLQRLIDAPAHPRVEWRPQAMSE